MVFLGGQIYDRKHCFLADGFHERWLVNIETLRQRFPGDVVFHIGHGGPVGPSAWDWQRDYIQTFLGAVADADWANPELAHAAVIASVATAFRKPGTEGSIRVIRLLRVGGPGCGA